MRSTKNRGIIQWFIRLFKKGMDEYEENRQQKEKIYQGVKERQKSEREERKWTIDRQ